ncbi:unnamed protein product [Oikopleura dioica]|uniref:Uncharacterized protein n=2 Tax=Oikopleura dioica TaxID=34765 RepID=E4Y1B3_OIKDI|nr:unnamed protein product [Oikopleura dioica]
METKTDTTTVKSTLQTLNEKLETVIPVCMRPKSHGTVCKTIVEDSSQIVNIVVYVHANRRTDEQLEEITKNVITFANALDNNNDAITLTVIINDQVIFVKQTPRELNDLFSSGFSIKYDTIERMLFYDIESRVDILEGRLDNDLGIEALGEAYGDAYYVGYGESQDTDEQNDSVDDAAGYEYLYRKRRDAEENIPGIEKLEEMNGQTKIVIIFPEAISAEDGWGSGPRFNDFMTAAKQLDNVFIGFIEVQNKDFDYRDSGAWHFSIDSFDHFSCTVSSLVCQIVREKQVILAEPVIMPDLPNTVGGEGVIYILLDKSVDHAKVLEQYSRNLNSTFSEDIEIKPMFFDDQNFPLKTALARVKTEQITLDIPSKIYVYIGQVPFCSSHVGGNARTIGDDEEPIQLITVGLDVFQTQDVIDCVKKIDSSFSGDSTMSLPAEDDRNKINSVIEKIHADIIHVTGAMKPDAVCSAQNIMPPCEVDDIIVHFYLDMSNNIQEASRSYYQDVINEFAEAFQGTVFFLYKF